MLGLPSAVEAAFAQQLARAVAPTTPSRSLLAHRLYALQVRQGQGLGAFEAERDGGGKGFSVSTGGAGGGFPLLGYQPLLSVGNYATPGQGPKDLQDNKCVIGFAAVGAAYGLSLERARALGAGRSAAHRQAAPLQPQPASAALAQQVFANLGASTLFDGFPRAVNIKPSNVSPAVALAKAGSGASARAVQLAGAAGEFWGAVDAATAAG
jgi:hypothetical protein